METFGQRSRIDIVEDATGPQMVLHDAGTGHVTFARLDAGALDARDLDTRDIGAGAQQSFQFAGRSRSLDRETLDRLTGEGGDTATAYLDGVAFWGNAVHLHAMQIGARDFIAVAQPTGAGLSVFERGSDGALRLRSEVGDRSDRALDGITALDSVALPGSGTLLLAASGRENAVSVFSVAGDGRLSLRDSLGTDDRLPIDQPSVMDVVRIGTESFVLVGSHGTASLTVLSLADDGSLGFVDQVNDTRDTRFDAISAIDHITVGSQTLVAVGGADGGVSLFQLLPGGRLILRETLEDSLLTALDGIRQIEFLSHADGTVEMLVLSARDNGVTRLAVDTGTAGVTLTGRDGGAGNDVLYASGSGMALNAGAGDDVLMDGAGSDRLTGGAGADVFIFAPDGQNDTISGFDSTEDRIDLSAYGRIHDVSALDIRGRADGAEIRFDDETLFIQSADGGRLEATDLGNRVLFATDRVDIPPVIATTGGSGNDTLYAGASADTIDGGTGYDILSFELAAEGVTVDLTDDSANAGGAEGFAITGIEGLIGSTMADRLIGDAAANSFVGGAGNDYLDGGAGSDWLTPGAGRDTVDGGAGNDMVSFADLGQGVTVDLRAGTALSGGVTDRLVNIENITGTIYGDFITGNDADNRIRGLGDYDWITGSGGEDTIDGGTGRDMISYVHAEGAVTVDLGAGVGLGGQALGDTYISVERVTGSIHPDLLIGGEGEEDFRGLGGYDWFVGSGGGKDRYDGGSGLDTVAYSSSPAGVTASLIAGRGMAGDAARDLYTSIESLTGSNFDDILTGDNGRNVLRGMYGEDELRGNGGVDRITGGGSDDFIDGGSGWDYAIFEHDRDDYEIQYFGKAVTVTYIPGGGEGTDTIFNVEVLRFADDDVYL